MKTIVKLEITDIEQFNNINYTLKDSSGRFKIEIIPHSNTLTTNIIDLYSMDIGSDVSLPLSTIIEFSEFVDKSLTDMTSKNIATILIEKK